MKAPLFLWEEINYVFDFPLRDLKINALLIFLWRIDTVIFA